MHRLGGHVTGFSDAKMTRAGDFYQESIKDTVHMLEYYGDVIAMRHFQQGAPAEAASFSSVPIINCGDGWGEHPTQVLTDLYTVSRTSAAASTACSSSASATCACAPCTPSATRSPSSTSSSTSSFPHDMSPTPECKAELNAAAAPFPRVRSTSRSASTNADVIYMEPVVQADYTKSREEPKARRA